MNLLNYLYALIFILIFSSCGKDEGEENEAKILGTWQSTDIILRNCEDASNDTTKTVTCPSADCLRYFFTIDSTKTRVFTKEMRLLAGSQFEIGTFSVGETKINFCVEDEGEKECQSSKFTVNKSVLVVLFEDSNSGCTKEIMFEKEEDPDSN